MAVESLETELPNVSVETKLEGSILLQKENGILNQESGITFGSHGTEEPGKKEVNTLPENSIPKDAVDEWPAPKQIHTFYMVKYRLYDDQKTKSQLDQADRELKKLNQARYQLSDKIRAKKTERAQVYSQLRTFIDESKQYRQIIDEKRKEIEPLHQALGKLRNSNTGGREKSFLCTSEEELNDVIKSLEYRIQHESIPLSEEKQIIREIKQLEGTREKVIANAVVRAKIEDSHGGKESIQDQVKQIGSGLDGVRKEKKEVQAKVDQLDKEKKAIEDVIKALEAEEKTISEDREKIYERIRELRKQLDQGNAPYYKNRTTLIKARELAASKDVEGLRDLANTEVDTFISLWSSTKAFRDDYERRILPSLDMRQLSRDGRMRNPDEKPLVVREPPPPAPTEIVAKPQPKQVKEDSTSVNQKEKSTKQQKEPSKEVPIPERIVEVPIPVRDDEFEKPEKDPLPVKTKVDEAKLKELKREEEIAKAKQAQERKKKLAEKADREKKAKKKATASVSVATEEPTEATADEAETGTADEAVQAVAAPKTKERKEKATVRPRGKAKGPDSLPKIILKRKKATNYWTWAAAIAAMLAVLLSALGYYYMM
ncbi:Proton pump-interactor 1 [Heracleum sosnowskyi]|uniref:Proton pump-interactor 1 n=1 Tax=Heracleum sosnowskyi TaxID=360622 RepID=A0AAD8J2B3_9APIA|nr:Proton pump-interactor 1 [Heracleum sosnowskyi]